MIKGRKVYDPLTDIWSTGYWVADDKGNYYPVWQKGVEMERLTKKYSDGTHGASDSLPCGENSYDYKNFLIEKLGKYEDLEEQGRLIKLPCKVGDVVYAYCDEFGILEYEVDSIVIDKHITYQCSSYSEPIGDCPSECLDVIEPDILDFGETVFLTKSEAEAKLKELRGSNE